MRSKVEEPERLEKFINSYSSYHSDSKAIVLRLVSQIGNVQQVATLTGVSERTIYDWTGDWNKKKKTGL
ncbi:hypothetical protein GCM10023188_35980 [Pontibacter saemangeumensis]|uniref:Homeodomain-like domain-containing protein n=1 Tax=Pontibacter saemangeumensis TaxID=1084525 RepID=A0ABP8LZB6_9BACT